MNWYELDCGIMNLNNVTYIEMCPDEKKGIYSIKIHFTSNEILEQKYTDRDIMHIIYMRLFKLLCPIKKQDCDPDATFTQFIPKYTQSIPK